MLSTDMASDISRGASTSTGNDPEMSDREKAATAKGGGSDMME